MINVPFDQEITAEHIRWLVEQKIPESRTLDYKQSLREKSQNTSQKTDKKDPRKEFLKDVSAFANASGGDIVYGVTEELNDAKETTGIPASAEGVPVSNADAEKRLLMDWLHSGLEPRLVGVRVCIISGFPEGSVIVVRVPHSLAAPHMIAIKDTASFYSRHNTSNLPMDVSQIRQAFLFSENLSERIRRFRKERVEQIANDEAPVRLKNAVRVVLHWMPLAAIELGHQVDLVAINQKWNEVVLLSRYRVKALTHRYNLDGLLLTSYPSDGKCAEYMQFFRNGCIEGVGTDFANPEPKWPIVCLYLEPILCEICENHLKMCRATGVGLPVAIMLSLIGVEGRTIASDYENTSFVFDRDILLFPEIIISEDTPPLAEQLKPMMDMLWQAAGWEKSLFYEQFLAKRAEKPK